MPAVNPDEVWMVDFDASGQSQRGVGGARALLATKGPRRYFPAMSTVQEIKAAIPKLSPAELEQLRTWFEDYLEEHLELTEEVKKKLDESRREIASGNYTTRQPE